MSQNLLDKKIMYYNGKIKNVFSEYDLLQNINNKNIFIPTINKNNTISYNNKNKNKRETIVYLPSTENSISSKSSNYLYHNMNNNDNDIKYYESRTSMHNNNNILNLTLNSTINSASNTILNSTSNTILNGIPNIIPTTISNI